MRKHALRHLLVVHLCWLVPGLLYLYGVLGSPHSRGADLIPSPDAEEYALLATRLAQFHAPLIGLGLHDYPSRYSLAYPLLLAPFTWLFHFNTGHYWLASAFFGLVAVVLLARVGGWLLGSRLAGGLAAALFALHPATVAAGTANMSETAILMMFFIMLELARPWLEPTREGNECEPAGTGGRLPAETRPAGWARGALLGLTVGWLTVAKAPFVYWAFVLLALVWARALASQTHVRRETGRFRAPVALGLAGLTCAMADAAYRRWAFGAWGANGYAYWFPPIYAEFLRTFNVRYLWSAWDGAARGNLGYYGRALLGRENVFFGKYLPFTLAPAALALIWPWRRGRPGWRAAGLLAGWGAVGALFCGLYFYQSYRFMLLWAPLVDLLVAWGLVVAPFWVGLRRGQARRWRLWVCARVGAALFALLLARGEYRRVRDLCVHSPEHGRKAFITAIRPLLRQAPAGAWVFSNTMPAVVELARATPGPTGSLYSWSLDASYPLSNEHAYNAWGFALTPRRMRPEAGDWMDTVPAAWQTGPTQLIEPDGTWALTPDERRALARRPLYALVVRPDEPMATFSVEHFDATILPILRQGYQLIEQARAIQPGGDVTLYRLEPQGSLP